MALDVLGLPFSACRDGAVPARTEKLVSLEWFGKLDTIALNGRTAGDFMVNEGGKKVVGTASRPTRAAHGRGRLLQRRPYGGVTSIRFCPACVLAGTREIRRRSKTGVTTPR